MLRISPFSDPLDTQRGVIALDGHFAPVPHWIMEDLLTPLETGISRFVSAATVARMRSAYLNNERMYCQRQEEMDR